MAPYPFRLLHASFGRRALDSTNHTGICGMRQQKITREMRESGVSRLRVYCSDCKCSDLENVGDSRRVSCSRWPDRIRV